MPAIPSRTAGVFVVALGLALAGCASSGTNSRPAGATANRIVRAELESVGQVDAFEAVNRLRPRWMSTRGGNRPVLYVDGTRRNDISDLQSMRAFDIEEIEYMSGSDASTRFGTGHGGGAIMVSTRR